MKDKTEYKEQGCVEPIEHDNMARYYPYIQLNNNKIPVVNIYRTIDLPQNEN